MGDVYRREGSPFWYADLADPAAPTGRRRVSTKQRDKRKAREIAAAYQAEIDRRSALRPVGLPFTQAADHYLEDRQPPLSDTTKRGMVSMINKIVESEALGDFDLASLTHDRIRAFINERRQHVVRPHNKPEAETGRRITDETLRRFLALMSSVYRHAINYGLYEGANPVATFDRSILAKKKPTDRHLRERQVENVLSALQPEQQRIVTILALTGLRVAELCNLRWSQIDLKRKLIDLENEQTKTSRSRVIPFDDSVLDTLKAQKQALVDTKDWWADGLVFPSPQRDMDGRRTKVRYGLAGILKTVKARSNVAGYTNHRLRHSYASWLLQNDLDPITIRDLLGHTTLSTTTIYARNLPASVEKRVRKTRLPKLVRVTKPK